MNLRKEIREAITHNDSKYARQWNKMSAEQRVEILVRSNVDELTLAQFEPDEIDELSFEELTANQQLAVVYALKRPTSRR